MPEPPQLSGVSADTDGVVKLIIALVGAGGIAGLLKTIFSKLIDRVVKQDEYQHLSKDRIEVFALQKWKEEEALTETLRKEYQSVREQLYNANTAQAIMGLEMDRLREENGDLKRENDRFRQILEKLNKQHLIDQRTQDDV